MVGTIDSPQLLRKSFSQQVMEGSVCFPVDKNSIDEFLEELCRQRQASFLSFKLRLEKEYPDNGSFRSFFLAARRFRSLPFGERKKIIESPVFRIWFKQVVGDLNRVDAGHPAGVEEFAENLGDFQRIIDVSLAADDGVITVPGTSIKLGRYEVDKWVSRVTPPTYTFPGPAGLEELKEKETYSLAFFSRVMETILLQIRQSSPLLASTISRVVKMIIHLEQADFRSCSAERYVGIIFLTGEDEKLVEIEESLVHEFGHQLLYNAMEFDPIVRNDGNLYKLPWSGSERDCYGYFHALYIYTLLVWHFSRVENRNSETQSIIRHRVGEILDGCRKAVVDFNKMNCFTDLGMVFYHNLRNQVEALDRQFNRIITNK